MKWALLIFMITNLQEVKVELIETLEIETENLCKKGQQIFVDESKRMFAETDQVIWAYQAMCVQIRE